MSGRRGKAKGTRAAGSKGAAVRASQVRPVRSVAARWDAAQTTNENRKHWAMVDALSADAAASPAVRRILRNRARYEVGNNTYAEGIVTTLANDTVGTGARLQMLGLSRADAVFIEREFCAWADSIDLAEKLRTMRTARAVDGEAFAIQIQNDGLLTPVKLDLRLIEAEMVASSQFAGMTANNVDGITFDRAGNPVSYEVMREHPGGGTGGFGETEIIDARNVLHYFAPKRPGQRRGVPELTPALPLFAMLRRYTLSVLAASELAADMAATLFTDQPPDGEATNAMPFDTVEVERRMMMTLPAGWKMEQFKPNQPVSTYGEFKHEIINEIARAVQVPYNVAAGNSASYNYASGRLDFQVYFKAIKVERMRVRMQVLERVFNAWKREAVLVEGYLPQQFRTVQTDWSHDWFWDGAEHVDPQKEANAQATRLASKTTTLAEEHGRQGKDWEAQLEQFAKERKKIADLEKKYGISLSDVAPAAPVKTADQKQAEQDAQDAADAAEEVAAAAQRTANAARPMTRSFKIRRNPETGAIDQIDAADEATE